MLALIVVRMIIIVDLGGNPNNSIKGQLGSKLGWFGPKSRPKQDAKFLADGGTTWKIAPQVVWAMVPPRLRGGTIASYCC